MEWIKCTRCKEFFTPTDFYTDTGRPSGLSCQCKKCSKDYRDKYIASGASRNKRLTKTYGITEVEFQVMKRDQGNRCVICGRRFTKRAHIDHNHRTGKVRGLLCSPCNTGLGKFRESKEALKNAIKYLTERGSYGD